MELLYKIPIVYPSYHFLSLIKLGYTPLLKERLWNKLKKKFFKRKRKYVIKCSDYGVVLLLNFIVDSVAQIKEEISSSINPNELKDLISEKYVMMDIAKQFGIPIYDEDLKNRKSLETEMIKSLKSNIENQQPKKQDGTLNENESHIENESITPDSDDEVF